MLFVDTGARYALSVPTDPDHAAAKAVVAANRERLATSDYILDEVLTLFRRRHQAVRARQWLAQIAAGGCELIWVEQDDVRRATEIYFQFDDKGWSFTDCVSRVVMQRFAIGRAFSFDQHFRQFGTVTVVP